MFWLNVVSQKMGEICKSNAGGRSASPMPGLANPTPEGDLHLKSLQRLAITRKEKEKKRRQIYLGYCRPKFKKSTRNLRLISMIFGVFFWF